MIHDPGNDPNSSKEKVLHVEGDAQDVERVKDIDLIDQHLTRAMSNPDNIEQLESLGRVLSTRRISLTDAQGTLQFDPENFELGILLKTIAYQLDDQGLGQARTGISFRDVTSNGIDAGAAYGPSMSEIFHAVKNLPAAIRNSRKPPLRKIIRDMTGLVKSGEMLLVLGRPGSGCTTFLKTISGEIDQLKSVEGSILYDGVPMPEMLKTFKREVMYNPERKLFFIYFLHNIATYKLTFSLSSGLSFSPFNCEANFKLCRVISNPPRSA